MSDELDFSDLERLARRFSPRYDPLQFGHCPTCQLGPTILATLQGITWGACSFCATTPWHVGTGLYDDESADEQQLGELFAMLSTFDWQDGSPESTKRQLAMTPRTYRARGPMSHNPLAFKTATELAEHLARRVPVNYRLAARERELAALEQQLGLCFVPPTAAQLKAWRDTPEGAEQGARRQRLVDFFARAGERYVFPDPFSPGRALLSARCVQLLEAGAPFAAFYRIQAQGEWRSERERR
jgi:hypothetical protein